MRVARVIGTVTLSHRCPELPPGRLVVAQPETLEALRDGTPATAECVIAYDELNAGRGTQIAVSEGREAAMPFHPNPVPLDAYCAAILDEVHV